MRVPDAPAGVEATPLHLLPDRFHLQASSPLADVDPHEPGSAFAVDSRSRRPTSPARQTGRPLATPQSRGRRPGPRRRTTAASPGRSHDRRCNDRHAHCTHTELRILASPVWAASCRQGSRPAPLCAAGVVHRPGFLPVRRPPLRRGRFVRPRRRAVRVFSPAGLPAGRPGGRYQLRTAAAAPLRGSLRRQSRLRTSWPQSRPARPRLTGGAGIVPAS